ncbi:hypothetical protein BBBOND_0312950 [Babesia bigemina]|uniref:Uncharacterized protein n=1 Tax=Babesia bigemina TaxID=5866 RepID=A0A061DBQ9_BABBI|nr:hypothetical protein BBBOND_0312950 [Babesia bigemina]CDR97392.1 hypothetical protein BBBOND_0312950 [Babesia bigemina]|eukprot:XP_012769578.1 hypothetical protein BBBOND_0312950 [Babesia bigemina]
MRLNAEGLGSGGTELINHLEEMTSMPTPYREANTAPAAIATRKPFVFDAEDGGPHVLDCGLPRSCAVRSTASKRYNSAMKI